MALEWQLGSPPRFQTAGVDSPMTPVYQPLAQFPHTPYSDLCRHERLQLIPVSLPKVHCGRGFHAEALRYASSKSSSVTSPKTR